MKDTRFILNGGQLIQKQIEKALSKGKSQIVVSGNYEIEKEIVLPSNFTIVLEDCYLRLKDNVYCNVFVNSAFDKNRLTLAEADKNIKIIGRGRAIVDGGNHNGLNERTSKSLGIPTWRNRMILFVNVDGFEVSNLHLRNQRHWTTCFKYCRNGLISGLDFCANDSAIYYQGKKDFTVDYLTMWNRSHERWVNGDGIDINHGCHDIIVENITGFNDDDTIALNNTMPCDNALNVKDGSPDIYNIIIRNVNSSSWCANVRILCQGGSKLYNVLVDGVFDSSKDSEHMTRGVYCVNVGDSRLYGSRHSSPDEVFNITVRNIYSRAEKAVRIAGAVTNLKLENVNLFDGGGVKLFDDNATLVDSEIKI